VTPEYLARHERRLKHARLILADCNLRQESLVWLARFAGKLVVEPVSVAKSGKLRALRRLGICAVALNRLQAENLCGLKVSDVKSAFAAAADLHRQGFERVVVTLGPGGAAVSHEGHGSAHVEAFGVASRDVTGGGDAAAAGLIFGLMQDLDLVSSARLGQAAASLAVAGMDTVSPDLTRSRLLSLTASRKDGS